MKTPESGGDANGGTPGGGELLNAEAVAQIIQMRRDYVYELARRGAIPHLRFGRTLRFRRRALDQWLADSERGSGTPRRT